MESDAGVTEADMAEADKQQPAAKDACAPAALQSFAQAADPLN